MALKVPCLYFFVERVIILLCLKKGILEDLDPTCGLGIDLAHEGGNLIESRLLVFKRYQEQGIKEINQGK